MSPPESRILGSSDVAQARRSPQFAETRDTARPIEAERLHAQSDPVRRHQADETPRRRHVARLTIGDADGAGYWTLSDDRKSGVSMIVFEGEEAARGAAAMVENGPFPE